MFHSYENDNSVVYEVLNKINLILDLNDMQKIQSFNFLSRNHEPQPSFEALKKIALKVHDSILSFYPSSYNLSPFHEGLESIDKGVGNCERLCLAFSALCRREMIKLPPLYLTLVVPGDHIILVIDPQNTFKEGDEISRETLSDNAFLIDPWSRTIINRNFPKRAWPQDFLGIALFKDESEGGYVSLPIVEPVNNGKKYIVHAILN